MYSTRAEISDTTSAYKSSQLTGPNVSTCAHAPRYSISYYKSTFIFLCLEVLVHVLSN